MSAIRKAQAGSVSAGRLGVVLIVVALSGVLLHTYGGQPQHRGGVSPARSAASPGLAQSPAAAAATTAASPVSVAAAEAASQQPHQGQQHKQQHPLEQLPKYWQTPDKLASVVLSASQQHGVVTKGGPLPLRVWDGSKEKWREKQLMDVLRQEKVQPQLRRQRYWGHEPNGQPYLKPWHLPFPSCHIFVNHKYRMVFINHPKSASTATKQYLHMCATNATDGCLSNWDVHDPREYERVWASYTVFTFVRNPWVRAFSSWKFLTGLYMRPQRQQLHAGGSGVRPAAACPGISWREFCGDPLLLGRVCLANRSCCATGPHFMLYHTTDQATCLLTGDGQLAVDFVGRVEHMDDDMRAVIGIINSKLPPDVKPLQLPSTVQPFNVGPRGAGSRARVPDNSQYLPAYRGQNATCFAKLARFYEKDVRIMFPALYAAAAAAAAAAQPAGSGTSTGQP